MLPPQSGGSGADDKSDYVGTFFTRLYRALTQINMYPAENSVHRFDVGTPFRIASFRLLT
jgi:hypothetical protein